MRFNPLTAQFELAAGSASVDGVPINPSSIGATTGLASLHLANEAEIVAHEAGGAVQARLAYLDGYACWVFRNAASGFANIYSALAYVKELTITDALYGFGITLQGTLISSKGTANKVCLSNGANAQTFEIYATDTSSSVYELLSFKYDSGSGAFVIGTEKGASGGSARPLWFSVNGNFVKIDTAGNLSAANGSVILGSRIYFGNYSKGTIASLVDGNVILTDAAETGFGLLQFGGQTSAYPALKRSGTTLSARLADDSADAPFTAATVKTTPVLFASLPAAGTIGDGAHAFITDSNLSYNSLNIGSAVSGGGANSTPVVTIGGAWVVG